MTRKETIQGRSEGGGGLWRQWAPLLRAASGLLFVFAAFAKLQFSGHLRFRLMIVTSFAAMYFLSPHGKRDKFSDTSACDVTRCLQ